MKTRSLKNLFLAGAIMASAMAAQAIPSVNYYDFALVPSNNGNPTLTGLELSVSDLGGSKVGFLFKNSDTVASSITQIYFENITAGYKNKGTDYPAVPPPLSYDSMVQSAGVSYGESSDTKGFPPGLNNSWKDSAFEFNPDSPVSRNGIAFGGVEYLGITFTLTGSFEALIAQLDDSTWRIGMHVQSIGTKGGSDSYVLDGRRESPDPGNPVPDGGSTLALLGLAGFALAAVNRVRGKA